jgi:hypothetical protein
MEYGWSDAAYKVVLKNFSKASAGGSQKATQSQLSKLRCIGRLAPHIPRLEK